MRPGQDPVNVDSADDAALAQQRDQPVMRQRRRAMPVAADHGGVGDERIDHRFLDRVGVRRFALYLHDFGSQIGLRLAMRQPERIAALIIQNGDIYEDQLGPKYEPLQRYFRDPTPEARAARPLGSCSSPTSTSGRRRDDRAARRGAR